jgi:ring-1,2-phenylacetyl-CoA epoxidase subunit PaaD
LLQNSYTNFQINTTLSPAWTTDWMTESGRNKLKAYGIAPPHYTVKNVANNGSNDPVNNATTFPHDLFSETAVPCPRCNSHNTHLISRFGATSCKSLYQCDDCLEPFDFFKCH